MNENNVRTINVDTGILVRKNDDYIYIGVPSEPWLYEGVTLELDEAEGVYYALQELLF